MEGEELIIQNINIVDDNSSISSSIDHYYTQLIPQLLIILTHVQQYCANFDEWVELELGKFELSAPYPPHIILVGWVIIIAFLVYSFFVAFGSFIFVQFCYPNMGEMKDNVTQLQQITKTLIANKRASESFHSKLLNFILFIQIIGVLGIASLVGFTFYHSKVISEWVEGKSDTEVPILSAFFFSDEALFLGYALLYSFIFFVLCWVLKRLSNWYYSRKQASLTKKRLNIEKSISDCLKSLGNVNEILNRTSTTKERLESELYDSGYRNSKEN